MSWSSQSYNGPVEGYAFELQSPPDRSTLAPRSAAQVDAAEAAIGQALEAFEGCRVAVSAYGHAQPEAGQQGDTFAINISSVAEPEPDPEG